VIAGALAAALQAAGVRWHPQNGDWFCLDTDDVEPWLVAPGAVEFGRQDGHIVLMFHGASEWALDTVYAIEATWLPSEGQLRALVAAHAGTQAVLTLESRSEGVRARLAVDDWLYESSALDAADAYAGVLLALIERQRMN
jgi:hypothetical protein